MQLHNRTILITGGGSGIGLELARALAVQNDVAIAGRNQARLLRAVNAEPRLRAIELDVTSEGSAQSALAQSIELLGGLDVLVNAAGVAHAVALEDPAAPRAVEEDIATNLVGALRMSRLALPHLRKSESGALVFISSALALTAAPGLVVYGATKAAIHSVARSLRAELAGQVRVFDVLPPFVDTELAAGLGHNKLSARAVAREIVSGLERDRLEIRIGRVSALAVMTRVWPAAADRIVARELAAPA
jgi:uncharacterized oxidoreductase